MQVSVQVQNICVYSAFNLWHNEHVALKFYTQCTINLSMSLNKDALV